ncbi:eIF3 subunit 6 N terminal domain-containing protein [Hyaloraphidium curvatum]|nr:eIF3 subunit 6 N terminal domain-containing protein [Hyaloraphidium curvatum]
MLATADGTPAAAESPPAPMDDVQSSPSPLDAASYDLTPRIIPFLDRHMAAPLVEFLISTQMYPDRDLQEAKLDLLLETKMIDYTNEVYQQVHGTEDNLPGYESKRQAVLDQLQALGMESEEIMAIIKNEDVVKEIKNDKLANMKFLEDNYGFKPEMLAKLYELAQFQYACGDYAGAADMLYHYRILSTDYEMNVNALWGKLAAEILTQNLEVALEDLNKLKELIDQKSFVSHLFQLQQRTWLIHWSLFVFFNHPKGRDGIIDLFFQPAYINTIQTTCPWILRYLTTAVITNKKRRSSIKDLVKIIQMESVIYRDPITEFVESLYINFDFEKARTKLRECEEARPADFFLVATRDDFIENARLFIFETYCRIHERIDINKMSEMLNLPRESGEKWIVNLIRNARLDAKIDAKTNSVVMGLQSQSVYQQVIERTKAISFRTSVLLNNVRREKPGDEIGEPDE